MPAAFTPSSSGVGVPQQPGAQARCNEKTPEDRETFRGLLDFPIWRLGLLNPDLAPAVRVHELAGEDIARPIRITRVALQLHAGAAHLPRLVGRESLGVDALGIFRVVERLRRGIRRAQVRGGVRVRRLNLAHRARGAYNESDSLQCVTT